MSAARLVLLPGMDGTGALFAELLDALPSSPAPLVVSYPTDRPLALEGLVAFVEPRLPRGEPFVLVGESFSGPVAVRLQHFIHHLGPSGFAGFVLANGSMSSRQSGEGEIRRRIVEADIVDCIVALPGGLFYSTMIPACLWFIARSKKNGRYRDRRGETLFIDARTCARSRGRRRGPGRWPPRCGLGPPRPR